MKLEKSGEVVPTGRKEKLVSYYKRISTYLRQRSSFAQSPAAWTFLILVGVMTAIVATVVDLLANLLLAGRRGMSDGMASLPAAGFFAGWIAWFFWMLFFGTLSGVAGHLLSKQCEGSGVPEMKSILSGESPACALPPPPPAWPLVLPPSLSPRDSALPRCPATTHLVRARQGARCSAPISRCAP